MWNSELTRDLIDGGRYEKCTYFWKGSHTSISCFTPTCLILCQSETLLFQKVYCTLIFEKKKNHSLALDLSIAVFISATLQRKVGARPLVRIVHNSKISSGHCLEFLF